MTSTLAEKVVFGERYRVDAEGLSDRTYWLLGPGETRKQYPSASAAIGAFEELDGVPFRNDCGPDLSAEAGFTYAGTPDRPAPEKP